MQPSSSLTLVAVLVFAGPTIMSGCQSYTAQPIPQTDGYHTKLPVASTKAVVWGTRSEVVQSLTTWLLKRGLTVVDEVKMTQVAGDIRLNQNGIPANNADVLRVGKVVGAKQVIFVDADVSTWRTGAIEGAFGQPRALHSASVFIRAVDVDTGEIHWSGKALSTEKFPNLQEGIDQLTCHALATAWGLRPPGSITPAGICPIGQNAMVVTDPPAATPPNTAKARNNGAASQDTY